MKIFNGSFTKGAAMSHSVNTHAFRSVSCGVYVVSTATQEKPYGCIINTFLQVTSTPAQVSIALNKENVTTQALLETGFFEVSILSESATMEMIGTFGFQSSKDINKFEHVAYKEDSNDIPYLVKDCVAHVGARIVQKIDVGTHYIFIGEVYDADTLCDDSPMTYAYYHQVKGGKTPPRASSYNGGEEVDAQVQSASSLQEASHPKIGWKCKLCGYVVEMDELPDDFHCPVCGVGKEMFERIDL